MLFLFDCRSYFQDTNTTNGTMIALYKNGRNGEKDTTSTADDSVLIADDQVIDTKVIL